MSILVENNMTNMPMRLKSLYKNVNMQSNSHKAT